MSLSISIPKTSLACALRTMAAALFGVRSYAPIRPWCVQSCPGASDRRTRTYVARVTIPRTTLVFRGIQTSPERRRKTGHTPQTHLCPQAPASTNGLAFDFDLELEARSKLDVARRIPGRSDLAETVAVHAGVGE